eukprot:CAMPEP_0195657020 /NCGR_PEP_ID=MMETSP0815-20121206/35296_1 /TAXON_ID=97485 /ORGANISM="Prymnesium parvum, Strain Texoma1" /LENGTH=79 /DNA_ID=CAMNT_0040801401 /DNA_START=254 /DNA_END=493 /DNA_ORIENTATION=+
MGHMQFTALRKKRKGLARLGANGSLTAESFLGASSSKGTVTSCSFSGGDSEEARRLVGESMPAIGDVLESGARWRRAGF